MSGTVTYDGEEIEKGWISFYPVDGQGPTTGAEIIDGEYIVMEVTPGRKRVQIEAQRKPPADGIKSIDVQGGRKRKAFPKLIPTGAVGNNQIVEIVQGKQTHDFHLEKPKK